MIKRKIFFLVALIAMFSQVALCEIIMQIACKVNGQAITDYEIRTLVDSYIREKGRYISPGSDEYMKLSADVLESLINDLLLYQAADLEGIQIPDSVLKKEIERIKESVNAKTDEELIEKLDRENLTLSSLIDNIKRRNTVQYFVRQKIQPPVITESDALAYYEENREDFLTESQLDLSIITAGPEMENARIIYNKIMENGDFESAAREYSTHEASKNLGGNLGLINISSLNETFRKMLENPVEGMVTEPFLYDGSYNILKVNRVLPKSYREFSELKENIRDMLYNKKLEQKYADLLKDLRKNSVIEFVMPFYEKVINRYGGNYAM